MNKELIIESHFFKLFKKYVILLFVFAVINFILLMVYPILFDLFIEPSVEESGFTLLQSFWLRNFPNVLMIVINIIMLFIIKSDHKNGNYFFWGILGVTFFHREIGVFLFLLLELYLEKFNDKKVE